MTRSLITNFSLALVTLLLALLALGFIIFEIENKASILQEQLISIEAQNNRESNFYTLQKKLEESADDRLAVEKYFLTQSSDSIDFLNTVEQLAPQSGVTLVTETLEEATDKKTKQKYIEAKFSFSGTENNVEQFIELIEALPQVSHITTMSLSVQSSEVWEAKVTIRVFILNYEI